MVGRKQGGREECTRKRETFEQSVRSMRTAYTHCMRHCVAPEPLATQKNKVTCMSTSARPVCPFEFVKNEKCIRTIALLRASKQQNLRRISMSAKSKYFAKLWSEELRVKCFVLKVCQNVLSSHTRRDLQRDAARLYKYRVNVKHWYHQ